MTGAARVEAQRAWSCALYHAQGGGKSKTDAHAGISFAV